MKTTMTRMMEHSAENQKHRTMNFCSLVLALIAVTLGWGTAGAQAQSVHGVGTANTIPVWTNSTTIGNSLMMQSGGNVSVNGGLAATTLSGNGSSVTNVNALTLGGLGSSAFAQVGAQNTFTTTQTIEGNLNLTGSINDTLTLQGNVTDSSGEESANVIGGFGGSGSVPGNSVASGVVGATIAGGGGTLPGFPGPNTVTAAWGTVGGGSGNTASRFATVGGGTSNSASGFGFGTVGGGRSNTAGEFSTVAGGDGNTASGLDATVPGGFANTAAGEGSFAAGKEATANNNGSFVWSDNSSGGLSDTGANSFVARASGGFTFYTAPGTSTGATLMSGSGSWSSLSDRSVKANFMLVDGKALLATLAALPIATWNYTAQADSIRHMGPTAQDFRAAFGLGEDERHISTVDSEGVALAAIQALYKLSQEQVQLSQQQVQELTRQVNELQNQMARLTGTR